MKTILGEDMDFAEAKALADELETKRELPTGQELLVLGRWLTSILPTLELVAATLEAAGADLIAKEPPKPPLNAASDGPNDT